MAALLASQWSTAAGLAQLSDATRRAFLGRSAAAAAATAAAPLVLPSGAAADVAATTTNSAATAGAGAGGTAAVAAASGTAPFAIEGGKAVKIPPIGTGAWAWGDPLFWGYDPKNDGELQEVFDYAVEANVGFFDTAELYGFGRSEQNIRRFRDALPKNSNQVSIATKFAPLPYLTKREQVVSHAKASVERLGAPIDLYQIHFPNAWSNAAYWDGLADCFDQGLVRSVGVSNYGSDAVRACAEALGKRGIPLSSNQIQMSLLYRNPLDNGLKATCDELGVKVIAYSPLALGFLTGKYSKDRLPSGPRSALGASLFADGSAFPKLEQTMRDVAAAHGDAPLAQVALNWVRSKGAVSIPGARNLRQLKSNLGTLDWSLTAAEEEALDMASAAVPSLTDVSKSPFPKEDLFTKLRMFDS